MAARQDRRANNAAVVETTIGDMQQALRQGPLTSRAVVETYLNRIDAYDRSGPCLNAVVNTHDGALARADELDQAFASSGDFVGPLHGVVLLVKDNIDVTGVALTNGVGAFADYRPPSDATLIKKLKAAGAIILGKTTLPDFATSWWAYSSHSGETRNPYALDRDPGGSSAGSGAACAANLSLAALGTDCGGSIRVPATCNNLVGVRATPGLISRGGVGTLVFFQDTVGPLTRTVEDAARLFEVMVGYDPSDTLSANYLTARAPASYTAALDANALAGARLALVTNAMGADSDPFAAPVNAVTRAGVAALRANGAEVVELEIPDLMRHIVDTSMYVNCSKYEINAYLMARPALPLRSLQQIYEQQAYHPMLDLIEACVMGPEMPEYDPLYYRRLAARELFQRSVLNVMGQASLDALIYPSVQVVPPTREQLNSRLWTTLTFPTNTLIASQTWMPAVSVPAGLTAAGLPVGLEFLARPYDEPGMFALAYAFEQATKARIAPACAPELE
jgi:amidase